MKVMRHPNPCFMVKEGTAERLSNPSMNITTGNLTLGRGSQEENTSTDVYLRVNNIQDRSSII